MSEQTLVSEQEAILGGTQFKDLLTTLSSIVDEVCLKVSKDGINVATVDPAHVSMLTVFAPKEAFTGWQVTGDLEVGIDIPKVLSALKRTGSMSKVKVKGKKIVVSGGSKRFTLTTIDTTGMSSPKVPDLTSKLNVDFDLTGEVLKEAVKDAGWMSDHLKLTVKGGELYASAQGDLDEFDHPIGKAIGQDAKSTFPLDYLEHLSKVCGSRMKVKMGNDYPIQITWATDEYDYKGELRHRGINYTFLLAPRIEAEDDEPQPSKPVKAEDKAQESEYEDEPIDVTSEEGDDLSYDGEESDEDYSEEEAIAE
jgi:DNA polymerase III sliding clamp (beta) subunit (PCNA family)